MTTRILLIVGVLLFGSLLATAQDVQSGPKVGAKVADLKVYDATGENKEKSVDYAALRKDKTTVYLFVGAGDERRLIVVHFYLFEDYFLFCVKVFISKRRTHDVGEQPNRGLQVFRQHSGVIDGILFVRERVVMRAHFIELAIHIVSGPRWRSLKDHVLYRAIMTASRRRRNRDPWQSFVRGRELTPCR